MEARHISSVQDLGSKPLPGTHFFLGLSPFASVEKVIQLGGLGMDIL